MVYMHHLFAYIIPQLRGTLQYPPQFSVGASPGESRTPLEERKSTGVSVLFRRGFILCADQRFMNPRIDCSAISDCTSSGGAYVISSSPT